MIHKGYIIKSDLKQPSLKRIVTEGKGGKCPDVLCGLYTDYKVAQTAIDTYLNKKGGKSGKTKATPTAKQS